MCNKKNIIGFSLWSGLGILKTDSIRKGLLAIFIIVLVLMPLFVEAQCAMCRAALESEADNSQAEGINNGIVYLMAIPYLLVGGLFYFIYRRMKR